MSKIRNAFDQTGTDKGSSHGYDRWYDVIFKEFEPTTLLEIGVMQGRSLAAWKLAFPMCNITGVDITDKRFDPRMIRSAEARVVIGDSTSLDINNHLDDSYDVIIDDGSHFYKNIMRTFDVLKDKFNCVYIIEDAMHRQDEVVDHIKSAGFHNVFVFDSNQCNIPVDTQWLETGVLSNNPTSAKTNVNLKLIAVFKKHAPNQT